MNQKSVKGLYFILHCRCYDFVDFKAVEKDTNGLELRSVSPLAEIAVIAVFPAERDPVRQKLLIGTIVGIREHWFFNALF